MDDPASEAARLAALTTVTLGRVASEHERLFRQFRRFDRLTLAASFGGLLTDPMLQSNCVRLETLAHLALAFGQGSNAPLQAIIADAFRTVGKGSCGRYEDPAEDVFVGCVATRRGNFRFLEGIWESAQFYLQRIVNLMEAMPAHPQLDAIRESVYAILKLSDALCERVHLERYSLGNPVPEASLPRHSNKTTDPAGLVRFSEAELGAAGVSIEHLSQFLFDPADAHGLLQDVLGHSKLERYPVACRNREFFFLLPTATSSAVRRFVLQGLNLSHNRELFLIALAHEYGNVFSRTPLLGEKLGAPIEFKRTDAGLLAGIATTVDRGRYLNCVFFIDTLEDFDKSGLAGTNPDPLQLADDFDRWIDQVYERARKRPDFREGLTLLVGCGIGRGAITYLNHRDRPNWRVESLSAPDLYTLSWAPDFKPRRLWRMLEAQAKIEALGVKLQNMNGLLNMAAWMRSLRGHLVPHGELPDGFASNDRQAFVMIEQNSLRNVRHDVAIEWDTHVEKDVRGQWVRVRKHGDSAFDEDRLKPAYAVDEYTDAQAPPILYRTPERAWWCRTEVSQKDDRRAAYERWRMLTVWLSRAAPVLDKLAGLPAGAVEFNVCFQGALQKFEGEPANIAFPAIRAGIVVEVDPSSSICSIRVGPEFDAGQFNVENVSERALVDAIVEGAFLLAGQRTTPDDRLSALATIAGDTSARQVHAFRAQSFRDYVQDKLSGPTITIDESDNAFLKLGLGWRIRKRTESPLVQGKSECLGFLNALVRTLEDELCASLRTLDRKSVIRAALLNHEMAIHERDRWRRTARAVLALHDDKQAAINVMARHDFKLNAVFLTTRLLAEIALCESPIEGGRKPGHMDLSALMGEVSQIHGLGGWSDAIRWDAIEPRLRVTPLGDVHAKLGFVEDIIEPFAHGSNEVFINQAVRDYPKHLEVPEVRGSIHDALGKQFVQAWEEQCGASLDHTRVFVDFLEDLGLNAHSPILEVPQSSLLEVKVGDQKIPPEVAAAILAFLTLKSRPHWRDIPVGYDDKDIQPWRFRRRLSVLRRPLLQLNDAPDPLMLIAPGLARDALRYTVAGYHDGDFPAWQLSSRMAAWAGEAARQRGSAFSKAVAEQLESIGWQTEVEVKLTKLLKRGFPEDYGDVDVLAWNRSQRRVLIIECKDVQYRKTYGEIAEQLADFRGELGPDGKPDDLLRHLNRVGLISQHLSAIGAYVGIEKLPAVESHLVFKNPVPMEFALKRMGQRVSVHIFERFDEFRI